ncbi:hypothetical protein ACQKWADRAFT_316661 [Trichoderma austrokoningii]
MAEIHRINDPAAWQGDGLSQLPFYMPDECDPWWHNTILVPRAAFCDRFWVNDCPSEQRMDEWPEDALSLRLSICDSTGFITTPCEKSDLDVF